MMILEYAANIFISQVRVLVALTIGEAKVPRVLNNVFNILKHLAQVIRAFGL